MSKNIIVLDLETLRSADDCAHCGDSRGTHGGEAAYCLPYAWRDKKQLTFSPIGWTNKALLGLSIGCYWDSHDERLRWFDESNLLTTVQTLVCLAPLMVSFNGKQFDFALMRAVLRRKQQGDETLLQAFKALAATSYDILAEIWGVDPQEKFTKGLNALDAISQANSLGMKLGTGAQAPRDWAAGRYADVMNYCANDVYLTKALFDLVCAGTPLKRAGCMDILLPNPFP